MSVYKQFLLLILAKVRSNPHKRRPKTCLFFCCIHRSFPLSLSLSLSLQFFLNHETLPNFIFKKASKKGREKEAKGKDQSPTKQRAQKRWANKEAREGCICLNSSFNPPRFF
jgi:hypothetical protein